ncbi:MAG: TerB family tellurite resistance protein [Synechococcaceae bacterium WB9_2_112]|nr:TerB family tellurite resistance protein [Synechococcaceae bacterium WB9_2_112]
MDTDRSAGGPNPLEGLTPSQRALLRIVCWVAWADGDFALDERQLLEKVVSRLLLLDASGPEAVDAVRALAVDHLEQDDLTALVAALGDADERQLAVKLALQMISISRRPEDDAPINPAEKQAYRSLLDALALTESEIEAAEWAARDELQRQPSLGDLLVGALERFGAWPSAEKLDPRLPLGYWL